MKTVGLGICIDVENNIVNEAKYRMLSKFPMDIHKVNIVSQAENNTSNTNNIIHEHHRSGSLTDSEESESSISCDSLNFTEFSSRPSDWNAAPSKLPYLPDSLLRDIRKRIVNGNYINKYDHANHTHDGIFNDANNISENKTCALVRHTGRNNSQAYENDKYYTFHINEGSENAVDVQQKLIKDDSFVGYGDTITTNNCTIRSNKGTIRGVKNRVRNGIATFLQMQIASVKTYKEKDLGKVVIYTTSMGIVRSTFAKCMNMKQILRTLLIKFEERDVFMSTEYQQEIKERMQLDEIDVPQLFVEGQHFGDSEAIERLNESGELRKILQPYKCFTAPFTCQTCGGYRLLPCPSCNGSKKSILRNHFTAEFVALKCMNCDEVGLVKCHNC